MGKLLRGSVILLLFSISILVFNASCSKDATAREGEATSNVLFVKNIPGSDEIWLCNLDGTNLRQVNIARPESFQIDEAVLSSDGTKIIIAGDGVNSSYIYTCNLDGSELTKIVDRSVDDGVDYGSLSSS